MQRQQQQPPLQFDPAVGAVGTAVPLLSSSPSNGRDRSNQWPQTTSQPFAPNFPEYPKNPHSSSSGNQFGPNQRELYDKLRKAGFPPFVNQSYHKNHVIAELFPQKPHQEQQQQQQKRLVFGGQVDEVAEKLFGSLLIEEKSYDKKDKKQHSHDKDSRMDNRGQWLLSQRVRAMKRQMIMECRGDIHMLNAPLLAIYESLIPPAEERTKQKRLLALLEKLVHKEWPNARLFLYGSSANSFGVLKSDVDVCLVFNEYINDKSEILLRLADILQSYNLQNVQAVTRARVPIVKLMDPTTGISCDISINNVLAVVNTKLLRDYAKIDARLRQLVFLVKHWAKSREVNETYRGTLSSYAYVLMCIHFLQQRRPAILPCLQEMEKTYNITVGNIECAYFDKVEQLRNFGSSNKETVAQLLWAFFNYWAYDHDYANTVVSIRTGSIISKQGKEWTRRFGNDRHLICIEDPFDTSHDLGRVVDKFSIRVLREEFERAADIMQHDPNPCVKLFEC